MTMNSKEQTTALSADHTLSKKEFRTIYRRSMTLDAAWNYERQQNMNFCYTMTPSLRRIYKDDKEGLSYALKRQLEFMACTPHIVTLINGIMVAMEEKNAEEADFDESAITAVRTSLMGPLAGIGDSLIWGTLLTIAVGIGTSFASQGGILGPILFFLVINVPCFILRYYCLKWGYQSGTKLFSSLTENSVIDKVTKAASILGLLVIGSMIAEQISIATPLSINIHGMETEVQTYFDTIMPNLLPMLAFWAMYFLLGKGVKSTTILLLLIIFGCITAALGIF